jgi:hypothetical protein
MQAAPKPVSPHHSTNELGVIWVRSVVVEEVAGLDIMGGRSHHSGG